MANGGFESKSAGPPMAAVSAFASILPSSRSGRNRFVCCMTTIRSRCGVVDIEDQKFLSVNNAAVEHYGYSREQFLAMTTFEMRPVEDRAEFARYIGSGKMSQGAKTWRHRKSDGSRVNVSIYGRSMRKYRGRAARLNAIVDITAQKQTDDRLLEQKLQMDTAINNMSQGLLMFDRDARLIFVQSKIYRDVRPVARQGRPGLHASRSDGSPERAPPRFPEIPRNTARTFLTASPREKPRAASSSSPTAGA